MRALMILAVLGLPLRAPAQDLAADFQQLQGQIFAAAAHLKADLAERERLRDSQPSGSAFASDRDYCPQPLRRAVLTASGIEMEMDPTASMAEVRLDQMAFHIIKANKIWIPSLCPPDIDPDDVYNSISGTLSVNGADVGSHMDFNIGLLRRVYSDDALAFWISHELAHLVLLHGPELGGQYEAGQKILSRWELFGHDAVAESAIKRWRMGMRMETETDADALGAIFMVRAGYDPKGIAQAFKEAALFVPESSNPLATEHPTPAGRLRAIMAPGGPIDGVRPVVKPLYYLGEIQGLLAKAGLLEGR